MICARKRHKTFEERLAGYTGEYTRVLNGKPENLKEKRSGR